MPSFAAVNPTLYGPNGVTDSITDITSSATSTPLTPQEFGSNGMESFVCKGDVDVNTPDAVVMASATDVTDGDPGLLFESEDHGFATGLVVQFTTSNALPTGISLATNYYVIVVDADFFMVATSLANALAGTAVDYTDTGTGNQTATPVALAGCTGKIQGSNDNEATWADDPNATVTITEDGDFVIAVDYLRFKSYRFVVEMTSGMITITNLQFGYRGA